KSGRKPLFRSRSTLSLSKRRWITRLSTRYCVTPGAPSPLPLSKEGYINEYTPHDRARRSRRSRALDRRGRDSGRHPAVEGEPSRSNGDCERDDGRNEWKERLGSPRVDTEPE